MKNSFDNIILNKAAIDKLFEKQLDIWELARNNYASLPNIKYREVKLRGGSNKEGEVVVKIQFNPHRIVSSTADIDAKTLNARDCFFCKQFRPKEQLSIGYKGVITDYLVQINPYPIFSKHLVIQSITHCRQEIDSTRVEDMLSMARLLKDYVIFC